MTASFALDPTPAEANDRITAAVAAQRPRLRAFVRRQVDDLAEVEDIVQDAFLELVSAYRLMEPVVHVAAWLQRVARNRIIDRFRQRSRNDRIFDSASFRDSHGSHGPDSQGETPGPNEISEGRAPDSAGPDQSYEKDVIAEKLVAALDELPPEQRDVFVAHELDGRSFKELAAETGIPLNTLLSRKRAATLHLRRRLQDFHSAAAD
jgi:RNA polymerase sigma factor (sigma-70 family)